MFEESVILELLKGMTDEQREEMRAAVVRWTVARADDLETDREMNKLRLENTREHIRKERESLSASPEDVAGFFTGLS